MRVHYNVLDHPETSPELMNILREAATMFTNNGGEFVVRHVNLPAGTGA